MKHEYFKDRISAYHDGDLPPQELELIARHLEECPECRKLLKEFEKFDEMVEKHGGLEEDRYWEESAQKIERAISPPVETKEIDIKQNYWKGLGWKLAAVAASVAVIGFIALHKSDIMREVEKDVAPSVKAIQPDTDSLLSETIVADNVIVERIPDKGETEKIEKDKTDIDNLKKSSPEIGRIKEEDITEKDSPGIRKGRSVTDAKADEEETVETKEQYVKEVPALTSLKKATGGVKQLSLTVKSDESEGEIAEFETLSIEGMDYTPPRNDLQKWRDIRDSTRIMYDRYFALKGKSMASFKAEKSEIDSIAMSEAKSVEKNLIEAYYNIGLLTDDPDELQQSIRFLENYIRRDGASYPEEAGKDLEELKNLKPD